MGERRTNPDTGVLEENVGFFVDRWESVKNDNDRQERVNPGTGVHEEDQSTFQGAFGHKWESVKNDNDRQERVNPGTGVHEEDQSTFQGTFGHKWEPKPNDEGRAERTNPKTGVDEEDQSFFGGAFGRKWEAQPNQKDPAQRTNSESRMHEDTHEEKSGFSSGGSGHKREPKHRKHADSGFSGGYGGGSLKMSPWIKWPLMAVASWFVVGMVQELSRNSSTNTAPAGFSQTLGISVGAPSATSPTAEQEVQPIPAPTNPEVLAWSAGHQLALRIPVFLLNSSSQKEEGELSVFSDGFFLTSPSRVNNWQFWKIAAIDRKNCPPAIPCGKIQFEPRFTGNEPPLELWTYVNYFTWWSTFSTAYRNWANSSLGLEQIRAANTFVRPAPPVPTPDSGRVADGVAAPALPSTPAVPPPLALEPPANWLTNIPKTTARLARPAPGELTIVFDGPNDFNDLLATLRWDGQIYRGTTSRPGCMDGPFTLTLSDNVLVGDIEQPQCGKRPGDRKGIVLRPDNSKR